MKLDHKTLIINLNFKSNDKNRISVRARNEDQKEKLTDSAEGRRFLLEADTGVEGVEEGDSSPSLTLITCSSCSMFLPAEIEPLVLRRGWG